jgi:hypothetical protein
MPARCTCLCRTELTAVVVVSAVMGAALIVLGHGAAAQGKGVVADLAGVTGIGFGYLAPACSACCSARWANAMWNSRHDGERRRIRRWRTRAS